MSTTLPEKNFTPQAIESKIGAFWEKEQLFSPEATCGNGSTFSLVIPPPNVTGVLHMGHALDSVIQDIITRWQRMQGVKTLWMPGTDHAGIATQNVVERHLKTEQGIGKEVLGREAFVEKTWQWATERQQDILGQFRRLGISPDWSRTRFTLDEGLSRAVRQAFVHLYHKGLITQDTYIVNWCSRCTSAISDIETDYVDEDSFLWQIRYPLKDDPTASITVATTRPETMLGDVAVAVNPEDDRYKAYIGKLLVLPLTGRTIPVIADSYVDPAFGTGALKITPAHDPNDFKLAQTHQLAPIWILGETGHLTQDDFIPTALRGMERFEARKTIETLLEAQGILVSKTPHAHRVGHCQRCQTTIEPLLSKQWFVRTEPLAERCLKSLEAGEIRFLPERWTKDYVRWLSNIQNWCISRQLWWGHQIPAWHCKDCAGITVALEDPESCTHCQSSKITQDPDVLDTWFSSGLWPFSTMGWPQTDAADYKAFYPTRVLVTGFDIIFFWVARMTMLGLELTNCSPFETVYIHGLIRDEKGQKMSKSKGNTVDPVQMIDEIGCDAFRFGLTSLITYGGQDIKLSKDKMEQSRLFVNKLWNASRFVLMNILPEDSSAVDDQPIDLTDLSLMDRWILSAYNHTVEQANQHLAAYRFGELADVVYNFTWNHFCDWYVEYSKKQLQDETRRLNTQRILREVLIGIHKLLHPVMPFITEEIFQKLPQQPGQSVKSIMLSSYPVANMALVDEALMTQVHYLLEVVRSLRNIRQLYTVSYQQPLDVLVVTQNPAEQEALGRGNGILEYFVRSGKLEVRETLTKEVTCSAINVVGQSKLVVPLQGIIDVSCELARLEKKIATLQKEQTQLQTLLGSDRFLAQAPQAVIEKNRLRLEELATQLLALQEQFSSISI